MNRTSGGALSRPPVDDAPTSAQVLELRRSAGACKLHVVDGLHTGADIPLKAGSNILGSAPDCDILLADEGVAEHHLEIVLEGTTVWLRRIDDAQVRIRGREVTAQRAILAERTVVQIGPCAFTLLRDGRPPEIATGSAGPATAHAPRPPRRRAAWLLVAAAVTAGLAGLWFFAPHDTGALALAPADSSRPALEARQFEAAVAALKAPDLRLESLGPRTYRLSGHVATQDQARALSLMAQDAPLLSIESRVVVGSQVADWIRDSLASPQLEVAYSGGGTVTIRGEAQGDGYRARLAQVHKQFARLVRIEDRTQAPARATPPVARPAPRAAPPALQALPVIGSDGRATAYVATDGRQRYYAGATLPDGRMIVTVRPGRIVLRSPNGETEEIAP